MPINIGVDIGGTGLKAGLVRDDGTILATSEAPTGVGRETDAVIADMAALCHEVAAKGGVPMDDIPSIGFGLPGVVDNASGNIIYLPNVGWRRVPFRALFQKLIDKPVFMENDATVAGLAEAVCGVSSTVRSSVFLTLGTGLGGGLVFDGKVYSGAHGVGSELGHMRIAAGPDARRCNCGGLGCLERYASAQSLIEQAGLRMPAHPNSSLTAASGGDASGLSPKIIFDAAKAGDALALELFDEFVHYLSMGIVSFINILDPEMFVLGGGISRAGAFLLDAVRAHVDEHAMYKDVPYGSIELARLGNEAGIIGAAFLAR